MQWEDLVRCRVLPSKVETGLELFGVSNRLVQKTHCKVPQLILWRRMQLCSCTDHKGVITKMDVLAATGDQTPA